MRRFLAALVSAAVFSGVFFVAPDTGALASKPGPLPDTSLTPGENDSRVTQANVNQTICVTGYAKTVRKVSTKTKSKIYSAYHVSKRDRSKYTIDHLIP